MATLNVKRAGKIIFFSGMIIVSMILISKGKGTTSMVGAGMYIFNLMLLGTVALLYSKKEDKKVLELKKLQIKKVLAEKRRNKNAKVKKVKGAKIIQMVFTKKLSKEKAPANGNVGKEILEKIKFFTTTRRMLAEDGCEKIKQEGRLMEEEELRKTS